MQINNTHIIRINWKFSNDLFYRICNNGFSVTNILNYIALAIVFAKNDTHFAHSMTAKHLNVHQCKRVDAGGFFLFVCEWFLLFLLSSFEPNRLVRYRSVAMVSLGKWMSHSNEIRNCKRIILEANERGFTILSDFFSIQFWSGEQKRKKFKWAYGCRWKTERVKSFQMEKCICFDCCWRVWIYDSRRLPAHWMSKRIHFSHTLFLLFIVWKIKAKKCSIALFLRCHEQRMANDKQVDTVFLCSSRTLSNLSGRQSEFVAKVFYWTSKQQQQTQMKNRFWFINGFISGLQFLHNFYLCGRFCLRRSTSKACFFFWCAYNDAHQRNVLLQNSHLFSEMPLCMFKCSWKLRMIR